MTRMMWILGSILGTLLIAAIFVVLCNPGLHYRLFHDETSFNAVMSRRVKPEDSVAHVTSLLGPGERVSEVDRQQYVRVFEKFRQKSPDLFPHGVNETDGVLNYQLKGLTVQICFRDGKLINFAPKDFEQPMDIKLINPGP